MVEKYCSLAKGPASPATLKGRLRTKLFQTEQQFGLVIDLHRSHGLAPFKYLFLIGHNLMFLQQLQNTSGDCVARALMSSDGVGLVANQFLSRWRLASTDDAPSNDVAERLVLAGRGSSWQRVRSSCEVHKVATIHNTAFKATDAVISEMINLSLTLEPRGTPTCLSRPCGRSLCRG